MKLGEHVYESADSRSLLRVLRSFIPHTVSCLRSAGAGRDPPSPRKPVEAEYLGSRVTEKQSTLHEGPVLCSFRICEIFNFIPIENWSILDTRHNRSLTACHH